MKVNAYNESKDSRDSLFVHWSLFDAVHRGFGMNERNGALTVEQKHVQLIKAWSEQGSFESGNLIS